MIGITIIVLFALSGIAWFTTSDEDKARFRAEQAEKEAREERERIAEPLKEEQLARQYSYEVVESARLGIWTPVDVSKLNEQKYHDKINSQIESYFLNYKGKDEVGFTVLEVLLMALRADCGLDKTLETVDVRIGFEDYDDTIEDDKLTFIVNTSSKTNDVCGNHILWFAVDPKSGEIVTWEDSTEENILSRVN